MMKTYPFYKKICNISISGNLFYLKLLRNQIEKMLLIMNVTIIDESCIAFIPQIHMEDT